MEGINRKLYFEELEEYLSEIENRIKAVRSLLRALSHDEEDASANWR